MDKARLIKLMSLTVSDNDNEALAALRMANKMLSAEKTTWEEILAAGKGNVVNITMQRNGVPDEFYQAMEEWKRKQRR